MSKPDCRRACALYPNRFTMEHMPEWANTPAPNGKYYAPQYKSDLEWYEHTEFPADSDSCISTGATWPLGQWLSKPYQKDIIAIRVNGDPYGKGYVGSQSTDGGRSWIYCGDIGARSRQFWRDYCRRNDYRLQYE